MKAVMKRLFGEEFNNLLAMNLITAALCVPVVTAGPALLALLGTLIKIMDDRCSLSRVKEYKALFQKKFWKGVALEAVMLTYGAAMVWCLSLGSALGEGGTVLRGDALHPGVLERRVPGPGAVPPGGPQRPVRLRRRGSGRAVLSHLPGAVHRDFDLRRGSGVPGHPLASLPPPGAGRLRGPRGDGGVI